MSKISRRIAKKYRYLFYFILSLSLISGTGFWLLRNFAMVEGDFGPESHFLQYPFLQVHGFAAFLMLMALGTIFTAHIPKTWYQHKAKTSGITMLTLVSFSMVSAYSLYYLVGEDWHALLGNIHAIVGILLPVTLFIHINFARKKSKKKHNAKHKVTYET